MEKYGNVSPGEGEISSNSIILTEQKKTIHMYIFTWNIGPRSSLGRLEPLNICVMRGDHDTSEMLGANQNSALLDPMTIEAHLIVHLAPSEHFWTSSRSGKVMPRITERRITALLSPALRLTTSSNPNLMKQKAQFCCEQWLGFID